MSIQWASTQMKK